MTYELGRGAESDTFRVRRMTISGAARIRRDARAEIHLTGAATNLTPAEIHLTGAATNLTPAAIHLPAAARNLTAAARNLTPAEIHLPGAARNLTAAEMPNANAASIDGDRRTPPYPCATPTNAFFISSITPFARASASPIASPARTTSRTSK